MKQHPKTSITEVLPGLWVGGLPIPRGKVVWQMHDAGIQVMVSTTRREPYVPSSVEVVRVPFADGPVPPFEVLRPGIEATVAAVITGRPVLVHCLWGQNRSALIAALAIYALTGRPGPEIVEHIQARRPGSLTNAAFRTFIEQWELDNDPSGVIQ